MTTKHHFFITAPISEERKEVKQFKLMDYPEAQLMHFHQVQIFPSADHPHLI
jgi:hypothetical protein